MSFVELPVLRGQAGIEPVFERWQYDAYFCGGYVRYMLSADENTCSAGDIDIYPKTWAAFDKIVDELKRKMVREKFNSSVAVTFRKASKGIFKYCPALQVIKPENKGAMIAIGTLEDIIDNFDFTVVRGGLLSMSHALADADFEADEAAKFLRIKNIHCPISSTLRLIKYAKKGYRTNAREVLKLFEDWENRPEEYRNTLRFGIPKLMAGGEEELNVEQKQKLAQLIYID